MALASCSTPTNIPYFQDVTNGSTDSIAVSKTIRIRPGDKVSIIVNSQSPKISLMFNLAYATRYVGTVSEDAMASSQSTGVQGYAVSEDGTIDFPVLGRLYIADMTRDEIARMIKNRLVEEGLVQDPVVTILDALSAAGDLTIYGQRENIRVIRAENGIRKTYVVNICSTQDLFSSPVYYLQQNDMIYVEPNDVRARQSTVNGNNIRSTSFWISLASLLTSVTSTIVLLLR